MDNLWVNFGLVFVFFLVGGIFSAAEMALVSLRESQVKSLANRGKRGKALQELMNNPNRFLSSVQIGVTLAGFLSSAFGAATLANQFLAPWMQRRFGLTVAISSTLAVVVVTVAISYFSIVLSELTAKRLAMQRPEAFALGLAPFINFIAKLTRPVIWLLGVSTNAVVRLLGGDPNAAKDAVTDAELRSMVANSASLGQEERHIVDELFNAGDRSLREVMVPRTEVDFLPGDMPASRASREVHGSPHSRYPVTDGSPDRIVGFLHVRDLMDLDPPTRSAPVRQLARPVLSLPETVKVLRAMTEMRRHRSHLAIVLDEYGGTAGIVTLEDLLEELIGEISDEYDAPPDPGHGRLSDVEGLTTLEGFGDRTGFELPEGPYDTVAGYFMAQLGQVPQLGDRVEVQLFPVGAEEDPTLMDDERSALVEMTVAEMDGRRIAWLSARRLGTDVPAPAPAPSPPPPIDPNEFIQLQESATRARVARGTEPKPPAAPTAPAPPGLPESV